MRQFYIGIRKSPDVKQEVLILTDWGSNGGGNATLAALKLQEKASIFALSIGRTSRDVEIDSYALKPVQEHLFATEDFKNLTKLVDYIESRIKQKHVLHLNVYTLPACQLIFGQILLENIELVYKNVR